MIGDAVYAACDALDGIKDGILNDPRKCHFDPVYAAVQGRRRSQLSYRAAGGNGAEDLSGRTHCGRQADLSRHHARRRSGRREAGVPGSRALSLARGSHITLGMPFLRNVAFEDPNWDFRTFRFDRTQGIDSDADFIDAKLGPIFNNMNPDLKAFQSHGGKLIQYHGWSDPDISPLNSINYYQSVEKTMGDPRELLSPVHGAGHVPLHWRAGSEHVRCGHRVGAVGREGRGAGTDRGDACHRSQLWIELARCARIRRKRSGRARAVRIRRRISCARCLRTRREELLFLCRGRRRSGRAALRGVKPAGGRGPWSCRRLFVPGACLSYRSMISLVMSTVLDAYSTGVLGLLTSRITEKPMLLRIFVDHLHQFPAQVVDQFLLLRSRLPPVRLPPHD